VTAERKTHRTVSRRGPSKAEIAKGKAELAQSILKDYRPSDGCPPLKTHWGGGMIWPQRSG
jgi:hypothetical protein